MIKLVEFPTEAPIDVEKNEIQKATTQMAKRIAKLQQVLFAEKKHSLLVVFQGMDSSGKDGAARNAFCYCSPNGVNAYSFKKPTEEEFAHDFLWRCHKLAPRKGHIQIFIRSHYEDILIQRVHNWISEDQVTKRIQAINAFEALLRDDNHTTVLKFYLNISKERQKEKLQERIDDPEKQWKHNDGDWEERKHWDRYMMCYQDAVNRCHEIPWIITPVDQRWYRNYFVNKKILETLEGLNMKLPGLPSTL